MKDKTEREQLADTVTDLAQTALTALEIAELFTRPAERRGVMDEAQRAILGIVAAVRGFAGLPDNLPGGAS